MDQRQRGHDIDPENALEGVERQRLQRHERAGAELRGVVDEHIYAPEAVLDQPPHVSGVCDITGYHVDVRNSSQLRASFL